MEGQTLDEAIPPPAYEGTQVRFADLLEATIQSSRSELVKQARDLGMQALRQAAARNERRAHIDLIGEHKHLADFSLWTEVPEFDDKDDFFLSESYYIQTGKTGGVTLIFGADEVKKYGEEVDKENEKRKTKEKPVFQPPPCCRTQ